MPAPVKTLTQDALCMSSAALSSDDCEDESSQSTSGSSPQLSCPGIGIAMHTRTSTKANLLLLFLNPLSIHCAAQKGLAQMLS
jgi:hypothetical protein